MKPTKSHPNKVVFKVVSLTAAPEGANIVQAIMEGSNGTKIRFYTHPLIAWAMKVWTTGKISNRSTKFITDDWYWGVKSGQLKINDEVIVYE
jgi:hypothetical protein